MDYLIIKWIHILSSTILFGAGIGSALHMFLANRSGNVTHIYFATRNVVIADWLFTTPAVIVQLLSGLWLMDLAGYDFSEKWIMWGISLYFFAGLCWLPVVWIQIKMRNLAKQAFETNNPLPKAYWYMDKWWIALGSLAFPAVVIVFYLMVVKP